MAASDAAMTTSESYKGALTDITSDAVIQSCTFYIGDKGEEVADYSHNFGTVTGGTWGIKSTSFFYYNSLRASDPSVTSETAMNMSES